MADEFDAGPAPDVGGRSAGSAPGKRGPSVLLLLSGIVALAVSGWALAGGSGWPADGAGPHLGWILVLAAIVVGALLVFAPGKR